MIKFSFIFVAVLATARAQSTAVSPCSENPGPLPLNAYVEGCVTPPCQLPQLQDAVINIVFKAPRNIRSMETNAFAILGSSSFKYDLQENSITCNFLQNTYCPLQEGDVVQYKLAMYIQRIFFVGISATVEFQIVDDNQSPLVCLRLPITIVKAVDSKKQDLQLE